MEADTIFRKIKSLPPEAQRQLVDYVDFLKIRYARSETKAIKPTRLVDESFIGIWKNREDLNDTGTWLRKLRKTEWREPRA